MSCCPPKSHSFLDNSEYQCKGTIEKVDDLEMYVSGSGEKCVIWNYDIFGFDGGRTRQNVDLLASQGFMVILPDYYRGFFITPTDPGLVDHIKKYSYSELEPDVNRVLTFARSRGANTFGSVGTCWGSFLVIKLSAFPDFKAGVSMHPSHPKMMELLDDSEEEAYKQVQCKQLFMSAGNDHENLFPGGLAETVLGEKLTIEEFPDMVHGWSMRADLSEPKNRRDVDRAVNLYLEFFKNNL